MEKKTILVTGNMGYVGTVLVPMLIERGYRVVGLDTGYYRDSALEPYKKVDTQIVKDIRDIERNDLSDVDAIIHLASLSNDPLGELAPGLTEEINFKAALHLAELARATGISRFVYASSQSMYGIANTDEELDEDTSEKNPVTAYARTKWDAECSIHALGNDSFVPVSLRPSTVFGSSPLLRTDIVFNNLVACAYTTGAIEIKSDGMPWRPVIHIRDVSRAFIAALEAPGEAVAGQAFNVGAGNFTVRELAEAAQKVVPGSTLTFTGEHGKDSRTYRVSFAKARRVLGFSPEIDLVTGGRELVELFHRVGFNEEMFRGRQTVRLAEIKHLIDSGRIDGELRWRK